MMKKAVMCLVFLSVAGLFIARLGEDVSAQSIAVISQEFAEAYTHPWLGAPISAFFEQGEVVDVNSYADGWVTFVHEDQSAHIPKSSVAIIQAQALVVSSSAVLLDAPTTFAGVYTSVPMGTVLSAIGYFGDFFAVYLMGNGTAYVHRSDIIGPMLDFLLEYGPAMSLNGFVYSGRPILYADTEFFTEIDLFRQDVVAFAMQFLGTPWRWGGTNLTGGVDCSGFVFSVFRHHGITLNRSSRDQIRNGTIVSRHELLPGDLVFFATGRGGGITHVGIYIGGGDFVHSSSIRSGGVRVSSLYEAYYQRTYVNAARIIH